MLCTLLWFLHGCVVVLNCCLTVFECVKAPRHPLFVDLVNAEDAAAFDGPPSHCTICATKDASDGRVRLHCGHTFHRACVKTHIESNPRDAMCPNCMSFVGVVLNVRCGRNLAEVSIRSRALLRRLIVVVFCVTPTLLFGSGFVIGAAQLVALHVYVYDSIRVDNRIAFISKNATLKAW